MTATNAAIGAVSLACWAIGSAALTLAVLVVLQFGFLAATTWIVRSNGGAS